MAHYTVLGREILETILERYPVGRLRAFDPLAGGLANSSIKIETESGLYVLSVCDEKDMDEISRLCNVLQCLAEHDFPTTRVIAARDGAPFIEHQAKPLYLKRFISGQVISVLEADQLVQVGKALARLHEIPPPAELPERFSYGIECFDELSKVPKAASYYQWLSSCSERIKSVCTNKLPRGFVHGDLFFDNMLFEDGTLKALLDFEEACNYYRVFDLGMAAVGCCAPKGKFSLARTGALVKGYQSLRPLEPAEREALQLHVEYGAVATSFWRYRQYNVRNPDREMRDHYKAMQDLAMQVEAIEPDIFNGTIFSENR